MDDIDLMRLADDGNPHPLCSSCNDWGCDRCLDVDPDDTDLWTDGGE